MIAFNIEIFKCNYYFFNNLFLKEVNEFSVINDEYSIGFEGDKNLGTISLQFKSKNVFYDPFKTVDYEELNLIVDDNNDLYDLHEYNLETSELYKRKFNEVCKILKGSNKNENH